MFTEAMPIQEPPSGRVAVVRDSAKDVGDSGGSLPPDSARSGRTPTGFRRARANRRGREAGAGSRIMLEFQGAAVPCAGQRLSLWPTVQCSGCSAPLTPLRLT